MERAHLSTGQSTLQSGPTVGTHVLDFGAELLRADWHR